LRKVMPPYLGGDVDLFRGQRSDDRPGVSWTLPPTSL
jgi:hypothetical protein